MSSFIIEKGIPVISSNVRKYPFGEMEIGDSFLYGCTPDTKAKVYQNVTSAFRRYSKDVDNNRQFVARRVEMGVRVWRTV